MEIIVTLEDQQSQQGVINLKNFIDGASIEGLERNEVLREAPLKGQMGVGQILGSVGLIVEAAEKPLVELVNCLNKYVENYRTTVTISTKSGLKITISHGRSMSAQQLENLIKTILESDR